MIKGTTKGTFISMKPHFLLLAILAAAASVLIGGGIVWAQTKAKPIPDEDGFIPFVRGDNPSGWNLDYRFISDNDNPSYAIALKAMNPTYKNNLKYNPQPLMGLAEVDLNKDKLTEIIAFPTEEEEEVGFFCTLGTLCPHYVIQVGDKKAEVLGVLFGYKVNRGDRVVNGYWTLKAFTAPEKNRNYFEEYAYSPDKKIYEPVKP